jgi:predicted nucleic acid-binding protein
VIEFFKGSEKGKAVKKLLEKEEIYISVLSLYEVGYRIAEDYSKAESEDYLGSLITHYKVVEIDKEIARKAIELRKKFKLPTIDCLIYASAKLNGAKVVSSCKRFKGLAKEEDVIII